jgi:hypothetical protein
MLTFLFLFYFIFILIRVLKRGNILDKYNQKVSDDGTQHSELLGFWTSSSDWGLLFLRDPTE